MSMKCLSVGPLSISDIMSVQNIGLVGPELAHSLLRWWPSFFASSVYFSGRASQSELRCREHELMSQKCSAFGCNRRTTRPVIAAYFHLQSILMSQVYLQLGQHSEHVLQGLHGS